MGAGAISWSVIVFLTLFTFIRIYIDHPTISTHHILDSDTREKAIEKAVPVPEDMGEDQIPDEHRC